MELLVIVTILCFSLSSMLFPCASHMSSNKDVQFTPLTLPRKLKINEETMVKESEIKNDVLFSKPIEYLPGKLSYSHKEANLVHAKKGTREEWMESNDRFYEFFTMDYSRVRRRRRVHNKFIPVAP